MSCEMCTWRQLPAGGMEFICCSFCAKADPEDDEWLKAPLTDEEQTAVDAADSEVES